jgi:hypothetical protein
VLPRRFQKSESLTFSMKLPELTNQSLRLLESILDRAHERLPANLDFTSCPEFIYIHGENICELGKDALVLEKQNRSRASWILVRPMLESLFALAAADRNPGFPPRKLNAEWKDENKRIRKWIDEEHRDEFQPVLEEAERKIRDVEQKFSIKEKRNGTPTRLPKRQRSLGTTDEAISCSFDDHCPGVSIKAVGRSFFSP